MNLEFATRRPVFIDGRLEFGGAAWCRQHLATTRPDQLGATILRHDIQFVVVPFSDVPSWFQAIAAQEDWRCVHLDDYSAIFFRGDFAPWIPALAAPGSAPPWGGPDAEHRGLARAAALRNPGGLAWEVTTTTRWPRSGCARLIQPACSASRSDAGRSSTNALAVVFRAKGELFFGRLRLRFPIIGAER